MQYLCNLNLLKSLTSLSPTWYAIIYFLVKHFSTSIIAVGYHSGPQWNTRERIQFNANFKFFKWAAVNCSFPDVPETLRSTYVYLPAYITRDTNSLFQLFWEKLKDFLISEIRGIRHEGEDTVYSGEERCQLQIRDDFLHPHTHLRLNYTSYDVRRGQDSLSLRSNCRDIFVPSGEDPARSPHPFWYARVLAILHVNARDTSVPGSEFQRVDVLWVCWFGYIKHVDRSGLDCIGFVPHSSAGAFSFISPKDTIRASHINPAFHYGRDTEGSPVRTTFVEEKGGDWAYYYVNRWGSCLCFMYNYFVRITNLVISLDM